MQQNDSRRKFIGIFATSTLGLGIAPSALASEKKPSVENSFIDISSGLKEKITIEGRVFDRISLAPLSSCELEITPAKGFSWFSASKAQLNTDDNGNYRLTLDVNKKERSFLIFSVKHAGRSYATKLTLLSSGPHIDHEHWEKNQMLGADLLPKQDEQEVIQFNLTI